MEPYARLFEPQQGTSSEETEEDSSNWQEMVESDSELYDRNWCACTNCQVMPTETESICCQEMDVLYDTLGTPSFHHPARLGTANHIVGVMPSSIPVVRGAVRGLPNMWLNCVGPWRYPAPYGHVGAYPCWTNWTLILMHMKLWNCLV